MQVCLAEASLLSLGILVICCIAWHRFGFDTKKSLVPGSRKVPAIDETSREASDNITDLVKGRFLWSLLP